MQKPIKRSQYLLHLSKEHHFELLFCWKIRQGIKLEVAPERIVAYIRYFWQHFTAVHFKEEEELLFTDTRDVLVQRALAEHAAIKGLITLLTAPGYVTRKQELQALADNIDNHVRFEERTLFPHLEQTLPETQLSRIGQRLNTAPRLADDYKDEFWVTL
jgi:hemerythrin-like domain-containing protein